MERSLEVTAWRWLSFGDESKAELRLNRPCSNPPTVEELKMIAVAVKENVAPPAKERCRATTWEYPAHEAKATMTIRDDEKKP